MGVYNLEAPIEMQCVRKSQIRSGLQIVYISIFHPSSR